MKGRYPKGTKFSKLPPGPKMQKGAKSSGGKRARAKRLAHVPL